MARKLVSINVPGFGEMPVLRVEDLPDDRKKYDCTLRIKGIPHTMDVYTWPAGGFEVYHKHSTTPYLLGDEGTVTEQFVEKG